MQIFSYTKKQALQTDDVCLDVSSLHGPVKLFQCHGLGGNQKWEYDRQVNISPGAEECNVGGDNSTLSVYFLKAELSNLFL